MTAPLTLTEADRPTAAIATNDLMAPGVLHAVRAHHLRVPEDISVIGIDDIAMAAHSNPPLHRSRIYGACARQPNGRRSSSR
jgi:LacI family transcriptional regulator